MKRKTEQYEDQEPEDSSEGVEESSSEDEGEQQSQESENDDGDKEEAQNQSSKASVFTSSSSEQCTFDLRNLVAVNSHQLDTAALYSKKQSEDDANNVTIPPTTQVANEEYLLAKAQDGCAQLIHALWQLPTEKSDAGPLVTLPSYSEIKIPRALVRSFVR